MGSQGVCLPLSPSLGQLMSGAGQCRSMKICGETTHVWESAKDETPPPDRSDKLRQQTKARMCHAVWEQV